MTPIILAFICGTSVGVLITAISAAITFDRMADEKEQLQESLAELQQRNTLADQHANSQQKPSHTPVSQEVESKMPELAAAADY